MIVKFFAQLSFKKARILLYLLGSFHADKRESGAKHVSRCLGKKYSRTANVIVFGIEYRAFVIKFIKCHRNVENESRYGRGLVIADSGEHSFLVLTKSFQESCLLVGCDNYLAAEIFPNLFKHRAGTRVGVLNVRTGISVK